MGNAASTPGREPGEGSKRANGQNPQRITRQKPGLAANWTDLFSACNPEATAMSLTERKRVEFLKTEVKKVPELHVSVAKMNTLIQNSGTMNQALEMNSMRRSNPLHYALNLPHSNDAEFDDKLFQGLEKCFIEKHRTPAQGGFIPYVPHDNDKFAWGFARQVKKESLGIPKGWGGTRNNRKDHSAVVFQKTETKEGRKVVWKVVEVTGCVELKMCTKSAKLEMDEIMINQVEQPRPPTVGSSIFQGLTYTLVDVWSCLSGMGSSRVSEEIDNLSYFPIPVLVLAGKGQSHEGEENAAFVRAELLVPKVCGNKFRYTIREFENFNVHDPVTPQVQAYMSQLCWGCKHAQEYCMKRNQQKIVPESKPLYGGDIAEKDFGLIPLYFAAAENFEGEGRDDGHHLYSSQGDLLAGNVKLSEIEEMLRLDNGTRNRQNEDTYKAPPADIQAIRRAVHPSARRRVRTRSKETHCLFFEKTRGERSIPIIVKVSSRPVHPQIVSHEDLFRVLMILRGEYAEATDNKERFVLSDVLLGMSINGVVAMTVMRDLRQEGYIALCPSKEHILGLWRGFETLVVTVLLELVAIDIVHCDLRPGHDLTMNILCKKDPHKKEDDCYKLMIIDLESLVEFKYIPDAAGLDDRYLDKTYYGKDAVSYLFWQVLLIAYTWAKKINHGDLKVKDFIKPIGKHIHGEKGRRSQDDLFEMMDLVKQSIINGEFTAEALEANDSQMLKDWAKISNKRGHSSISS